MKCVVVFVVYGIDDFPHLALIGKRVKKEDAAILNLKDFPVTVFLFPFYLRLQKIRRYFAVFTCCQVIHENTAFAVFIDALFLVNDPSKICAGTFSNF